MWKEKTLSRTETGHSKCQVLRCKRQDKKSDEGAGPREERKESKKKKLLLGIAPPGKSTTQK